MAYTGIDKEIYDSGTHFRPLQEYTQQQWTPPAIMGQNTNAGIVNTQAAGSYMGYPSYEEWLLAQGGADSGSGSGSGNITNNRGGINQNLGPTNITDYESEAYGVGPTWAGSWARAKDAYSKLPTPGNLVMKGIRKWKENREIKRAEEAAASKAGKDAADAAAAGQGTNIGGGWTQTNTGGGGATFTGGGGQTHQGFSNTPAGFAAAAESEGTFAQGGRIGMAKGKIPLPRAKKSGSSFPWTRLQLGLSSLLNRNPLTLGKIPGANTASYGSKAWRAQQLANMAKMGKWSGRAASLGRLGVMNPWFMAPAALTGLAKYSVGKAFDPYRDETGKIGAEGHAQLASAARAREALMAQRNAARQNQRAGGIARLL